MTQADYLQRFKSVLDHMYLTTEAKNTDYADASDAFHNFKQIEQLTMKRIKASDGILVRMTDKMTRIANLLSRDAAVTSEKLEDTLTDLAVYSIILRIWLEELANSKSLPEVTNVNL